MSSEPYIKSLEDELDWKLLDQLYGVVSQISSFCFEIKKFCITTEFVVLTLMAKFTTSTLGHSFFITALAIPVSFWFLDAVAYYYQVSIRGTMEAIRTRIKERNTRTLIETGPRVIAQERINKPHVASVRDAVFNHSMWIYGFLIGADGLVWGLYAKGIIQ